LTAEAPARHDAMHRAVQVGAAATSALPQVRFVADLVCPWCYLGFHRLMALAASRPFRLVWHPFLLNPNLPPEGVPRSLYLERKFGTAGLAEAVQQRAAAAASAGGLELRLGQIRRQPNTVAAHALLMRAGERTVELATALFQAFFQDGSDLGSPEVLARIGAGLGIDWEDLPAARRGAVSAHESACRSGVDGVPVFIFGDSHAIAGAQPTACLEALLDLERYRLERAAGPAAQGRQAS
jgi:predicted DsbA family dithiol-disulfide isomerase